jgi:hypothetical protein
MKRKSNENVNNFPVPHVFDLFGDVAVSKYEVVQWVENVARLASNSPRFDWYVENWRVVDKIKRAKIEFITLENYLIASNDFNY